MTLKPGMSIQLVEEIQEFQYGIVRTINIQEDGHALIVGHWWYKPEQLGIAGMEQELILSNHVFHITEDVIRDNIQVFPEKDWEKLIDFQYSKFYDFGQKKIFVAEIPPMIERFIFHL